MKHLLLVCFAFLLCLNASFAQDSSKHSFALNIGGFHQTPTSQSNLLTRESFHLAKHLGATYRLQLTLRQVLRFSSNYKNMKGENIDSWDSGNKTNYNELQTGIGYEFIIKKGKIEPYAGLDMIAVYSQSLNHSWFNANDTYETKTRFGYGGLMLLGLRYNASEKLAIGIETNVRYLRNSTRTNIESDYYINYIDTIDYDNFFEFNPLSAITVKYSI